MTQNSVVSTCKGTHSTTVFGAKDACVLVLVCVCICVYVYVPGSVREQLHARVCDRHARHIVRYGTAGHRAREMRKRSKREKGGKNSS